MYYCAKCITLPWTFQRVGCFGLFLRYCSLWFSAKKLLFGHSVQLLAKTRVGSPFFKELKPSPVQCCGAGTSLVGSGASVKMWRQKKHVLHYFSAYFYLSRSRSRIRVKEKIPGAGAGHEWTGSATLALSEEMYIFILRNFCRIHRYRVKINYRSLVFIPVLKLFFRIRIFSGSESIFTDLCLIPELTSWNWAGLFSPHANEFQSANSL